MGVVKASCPYRAGIAAAGNHAKWLGVAETGYADRPALAVFVARPTGEAAASCVAATKIVAGSRWRNERNWHVPI